VTDTFHVRLGNLVPNAPPVDFLVDGYPVLSDRAFGQVNDYTEHEADEYDIGVSEHGDDERLFEEPVVFEAGVHYTLLLVGKLDDLGMIVLKDGG
jgi:hypothetical protein